MTAKNLLLAKMLEHGFSRQDVAEQIGISVQALNSKLNNKREFKASEIKLISDVLQLESKDPYFFA